MNALCFTQANADIEERVAELLACMTLEEKVGQMIQVCLSILGHDETEARIRQGQIG